MPRRNEWAGSAQDKDNLVVGLAGGLASCVDPFTKAFAIRSSTLPLMATDVESIQRAKRRDKSRRLAGATTLTRSCCVGCFASLA